MQEFIGKYTKCKVFNDVIEESAIKQIYEFLNHPAFEDNTIRIMPDVHAGTGALTSSRRYGKNSNSGLSGKSVSASK